MKTLFIALFALISISGFSQEGTINGVVTYFFNKYQGDKPDLGAEVYIIDSLQSSFDYVLYDKFYQAKSYQSLLSGSILLKEQNDAMLAQYGNKKRYEDSRKRIEQLNESNIKDIEKYTNYLSKLNAETDEKFKALDEENSKMYYSAINTDKNKNVIKSTINATGSFSVNVKPGVYYVFIVSKNRQGHSMSEVGGKIYCKKLKINSGETIDVSHNFNVY
jgi:hypothetical protein